MTDAETGGAMLDVAYWEECWDVRPSTRTWSPFDPSLTDVQRLLRRHVKPGSDLLEIGFAPGKLLSCVARRLGARVSGIDYSPRGVEASRDLFERAGVSGDLRVEDVFATSFAPNSFDCVLSIGLIEHFDDPRPIVAKHVELARPGGTIVILVPNYGGRVGRLQNWLAPDNIAIHNIAIMRPGPMADLFDPASVASVRGFKYGRFHLGGVALERKLPRLVATALQRGFGLIGFAIPFRIPPASAFIAAVAVKKG
jgi:SAM-dependent methyltransferase